MKTSLDSVPRILDLSPDELLEIRGGGLFDPLKDFFGAVIKETVHCLIHDWDRLQDCFKEGMEEAQG